MTVTYASFIADFPELEPAGQTLIEAKIAGANLRVAAVGDMIKDEATRDQLVMYRAAHMLALSPYGMQAKMVSKEGETTYGSHYDQLVLELGPSILVL